MRFLKILWVAGFSFFLFEGALRLYARSHPHFIFYNSLDHRSFRLPPGSFFFTHRINRQGYNDDDFEVSKPEGVFRVAAVGDSFTFGAVPRDQNFITLADRALGDGVEILNFGMPRAGLGEYVSQVKKEVGRYAPDFVVVHFYMGNDLEETVTPPRSGLLSQRALRFLWAHFMVAPPFTTPFSYNDKPSRGYSLSKADHLFGLVAGAKIFVRGDSHLSRLWEKAKPMLEELIESCRRDGIPLAFFILPSEFQVYPETQKRVAVEAGWKSTQFDLQHPVRRLTRLLDRHDVPWWDFTHAFVRHNAKSLYLPRDTHWNGSGNALAARQWVQGFREFCPTSGGGTGLKVCLR